MEGERRDEAPAEALGLEPGAPAGSWEQPLDLVGVTSTCPEVARVASGRAGEDLWGRVLLFLNDEPQAAPQRFAGKRRLLSLLGAKVADAPLPPAWRAGDEFEAARTKALAEVGR